MTDEAAFYFSEDTPLYAARADQRCSWCLYVPTTPPPPAGYPVVVVVHGTERRAQHYRDAFAGFAEEHGCVVLAPLFPAGIGEPGELHNYKWLEHEGIRFDLVLLDMVAEVAERLRLDAGRLLLHGFSGGGHFVHRFLLLHPERVLAASIGAPGVVTLLDEARPWWVGVGDVAERFGAPVDVARVCEAAVQTVVGELDTDTWEITLEPGDAHWMPGANDAGATRRERIDALADSLAAAGVAVRRDVVAGVAHDGFAVLDPVKAFFADVLAARTGG